MKSFILVAAFLGSFSVLASEVNLATITSDSDKDVTEFSLILDGAKAIDSFKLTTTTPEGQIEKDDTYPVETVLDTGVTLLEKQGRAILKLKNGGFTAAKGGTIILDFLFNGARGTRKSMKLNLVKTAKGFILQTLEGKPASKLFIIAHRVPILGTVGVSQIQASGN